MSRTGFPVLDSTNAVIPKTIIRSPLADLKSLIHHKTAGRVTLGFSAGNRPVEAWYFPGSVNQKALVIGGMHGSELSSVEVANQIIETLQNGHIPYYDVIVVPLLFPDNAVRAKIPGDGKVLNKGRYTSGEHADPNRQMPSLAKSFEPLAPYDHAGRLIETENQLLLQLIQTYQPSRIANLHAIRDVSKAGIFADPRTDCKGLAIGFKADSSLAITMAEYIQGNGGLVPGNKLTDGATALYHCDPRTAPAGEVQKRNLHGSKLPSNRGYGVSLGGWATTAICEGPYSRDAMMLFTVEFPGYKSAEQIAPGVERQQHVRNVKLYGEAIVKIFLNE
ncbi:MAG: hypothetical protein ACXWV0_01515 [Flavisolibacter sp.]